MNRGIISKFCLALFLLVITFGTIQGIGNYLIAQMSQYDDIEPILDEQTATQTIKRMVLRLEPASYYTIQLGSFSDIVVGQDIIDQMADKGYRVYVKQGPPYKLWLGCFSQKFDESQIPQEATHIGQDVFLVENLLNTVALKFGEDDMLMSEQVAPLVANYDVLLKHSLKMFEAATYSQYPDEIWQQMIGQIDGELVVLRQQGEEILSTGENQAIAKPIMDLGEMAQNYQQSLQLISDKKNDKVIFLVQSYLLQLIEQYHGFITTVNEINTAS